MILGGWGNFPRMECNVEVPKGIGGLRAAIEENVSLIARGNGRSYGDAALNPKQTVLLERHNRILAFDEQTGTLTCESGVLMSDILDIFVPKGWFPSVTPGTKLVSVGGMVASDVHGKNHHREGSFCRYVESLSLLLADGSLIKCSRLDNGFLFRATCGGMGLTGIIVSVTLRLRPVETAWIRQETIVCHNLSEAIQVFRTYSDCTYSVAWIDCLARGSSIGRSVVFLGEHAKKGDLLSKQDGDYFNIKKKRDLVVPFYAPGAILNSFTVRTFNEMYYRFSKAGLSIVDYDSFFYPLDSIKMWNRTYGKAGFVQYQCVMPLETSAEGLHLLLQTVSESGMGSFLAVLKMLGEQDTGLISFPMEGFTLAMDFPMRPQTLPLLEKLDVIVREHGGRLYLAKDARATEDMIRSGYPALDEFISIRKKTDAYGRFSSILSQRSGL